VTSIQLHHNCAPLRLRPHPVDQREGSGPACHVTGAPVTTCKKLHRHLRQCCASSTMGPVQTEAAVKSPAGSRPLLKRRESPPSRREDDAPVPRSSNGSHAQRAPRESLVPSHQLPDGADNTFWQARRASLHLRHNDRVKKGAPLYLKFISFPFSSLSLFPQGPGKETLWKGSFPAKEAGPKPSY
jgi:hypothetical protein